MNVVSFHIRKLNHMKALPKRYVLPMPEWIKLEAELALQLALQGKPIASLDIPERNFLLCGVPVVPLVVVG